MSKEKKIIGINTRWDFFKRKSFKESEINNTCSLFDSDIVLICGSEVNKRYLSDSCTFECKQVLSNEQSIKIHEDYCFISKQLNDLLAQGKNIYVIIGNNSGCYKRKAYSDFIRNNIEWVAPYSFLPLKNYWLQIEHIQGTQCELTDSSYKSFFEKFKEDIAYEATFSAQKVHPILKIPGTDRIVGGSICVHTGKIIFLPYLRFFNNWYSNREEKINKFLDWLAEFDELSKLRENNVDEFPEWIDDYNIFTESKDRLCLQKLENDKVELQKQIDAQNERLALLKKYKGLFTSTGEQLENVIKEVFGNMGFRFFSAEEKRTDVIAKYNDIDVVMEIKGLTGSAAEKNAAQLEKWASDFIDKNEKSAKPLLVVNAFRELPLEQRTDAAFPNQMQSYSKSRNHCLITTTQLLCLFIEITENPDCKDERIKELLNTVGIYNRYKDYTQFIKKVK